MISTEDVLSEMYGENVKPHDQVRGLMEIAVPIARRLLIEDMREWIKEWESRPPESVEEFLYQLGGYCKDRGIE